MGVTILPACLVGRFSWEKVPEGTLQIMKVCLLAIGKGEKMLRTQGVGGVCRQSRRGDSGLRLEEKVWGRAPWITA